MKKIILLCIVVPFLVSCGRRPQADETVIRVDSIACADTVISGQLIEIQLWGIIGIDSCCLFSRIHEDADTNRIRLMVLASPVPSPQAKGDTLRLDMKYGIKPQSADSAVIEVINPGFAQKLSKTVIISKE